MASIVINIGEGGVERQRQELKDRILWEIAPESNWKTEGGWRHVFNLQTEVAPVVINIREEGVDLHCQKLPRVCNRKLRQSLTRKRRELWP